jgi:para-nitrobenzyl esterase
VEVYAGIPYAKPPVGELRWREPQDPEPWTGILDADRFAPMSMQPTNGPVYESLRQIIGYHDYKITSSDDYMPPVSEDSLYLNIWKPAGEEKDLPVLVYVHGGSLQSGQTWYSDYSGDGLAREGVIVVNMGYRLGIFGFFADEELAAESENGTTGNYGLLDQIKALEWVRDNISAFGGDPGNVTLAGESAGSACVSALCTSPLAKGLFRRAVLESSTFAPEVPPHSFRPFSDALEAGRKTKDELGCRSVAELRALPAEKLVNYASQHHHVTVDGYALTETPYESYKKGVHNEEAILHGYNSEESAAFILFERTTLKNYEKKVRSYYGEKADRILEIYSPSNDKEAGDYWAAVYGAEFFDYPHYCLNRLAAENGIPVYQYYFSRKNGRLGSWHSGEEVYLYGNVPADSKLYDERDRELGRQLTSYLVNFAKTGDPNGPGLPEWSVNSASEDVMGFGDETGMMKEPKHALFDIFDGN